MPLYKNADVETRTWPHLTHPRTGRTLRLAPGERVNLTESFNDPHLVPVATAKAKSPTDDGGDKPLKEKSK